MHVTRSSALVPIVLATREAEANELQPDRRAEQDPDATPIGAGWTNPFLCCGFALIGMVALFLFYRSGGAGWLGSGVDADLGAGGGGGE